MFHLMHNVVAYRLGKAKCFAAPVALLVIAQAPALMSP